MYKTRVSRVQHHAAAAAASKSVEQLFFLMPMPMPMLNKRDDDTNASGWCYLPAVSSFFSAA
eukprot:scaffold3649_cov102-Skeletonema_dohrnii-CCMP3373.AAC.6